MQTNNFTHDPVAARYTHRTAKHIFVELSHYPGEWDVFCGLSHYYGTDDLGDALLYAERLATSQEEAA